MLSCAKFAIVAGDDLPSALFLARVRHFAQQLPGSEWEPVNVQEAS